FEHGLLQLNTVVAMLTISIAGFALATIWLHTGRTWRFRLVGTTVLVFLMGALMIGANGLRRSWDLSENRRNSFSPADEVALRQIQQPLRVTVFLSPEDPRLADLEQNVLRKLRRTMPRVDVDYSAGSRMGLFENAEDHYGEVWYEMGGQKIMERSTIEEIVLETIYKVGTTNPPQHSEENEFPGYPLAARPRFASLIFY